MGKAHDLKMFTIEEANRLLPQLTEWLRELQTGRDAILALEVEIDTLVLVTEKDDAGVSPALTRKVDEYTQLVNRFYSLVDKIHESGCLLKDLNLGLIDFYSLQNNRVVFLCWKFGEAAVGFWHETSGGFSTRQSLPNKA